jgi:hypothetical protein
MYIATARAYTRLGEQDAAHAWKFDRAVEGAVTAPNLATHQTHRVAIRLRERPDGYTRFKVVLRC